MNNNLNERNLIQDLRRTLRSQVIFGNWKPFKNDEKCFSLSPRIEEVDALKYRCVCRPPFGKV